MRRLHFSSLAAADIAGVLRWTNAEFGESARLRYAALLEVGFHDLASDPRRPGTRERPEMQAGAWSYHLSFSRTHVDPKVGRVRRPRHLILYRIGVDSIEIGRVLHDSMELGLHLPADDSQEQ